MEMRFLFLGVIFSVFFVCSGTLSAVCESSDNPDVVGVFSDYDLFSIETLNPTLQKCHIWYDVDVIQQILLREIRKATEKFEEMVALSFEHIMQLYSPAHVLTVLPNIHALCIAYLSEGGDCSDIFDCHGDPINFETFATRLLIQIDPWLLSDQGAFFKARLTLSFLQRALEDFKKMSVDKYFKYTEMVFRPVAAELLMSLSKDEIDIYLEKCCQKIQIYLRQFETTTTI